MTHEATGQAFHARDARDYHVYDDCWRGRRIPPGERADGDGGKRLCLACADLRTLRRPS